MSDPNAPQEGQAATESPTWQPPERAPVAPAAPADPTAPGEAATAPIPAAPGDVPADPAAPGGPGGPADPGVPYAGMVEPPKKRGNLGRVLIAVIAVVVVVGALGVAYLVFSNRNTASKAKEGDCLAGNAVTSDTSSSVKLSLAACNASNARYKVVGLVAGKTEAEVKNELCQPFADKGAEVIYWQENSPGSGKGNVLCLAPAK